MGTNFYFNIRDNDLHIGKRSAAGAYCYDCGRTLCKGGINGIHRDVEFHDRCPSCMRKNNKNENYGNSAAGRELGFCKEPRVELTGIRSASSFTWDMDPIYVMLMLNATRTKKPVKDEYGRRLTKTEFYNILKECPIRFYDSIGNNFS